TPPYAACSSICESTILDRIFPGPASGRSTTAAAVSSQVVSMPSTSIPYPIHVGLLRSAVRGSLKLKRVRCEWNQWVGSAGPRFRRAPSPLVGEGWGGGWLLDGTSKQLRPPPPTPPHKGEGSAPSVWRLSHQTRGATPGLRLRSIRATVAALAR